MYDNMLNICQQFKKRNILYGRLTPNNIAELKPWGMVHVDLVGTYSMSIRQQNPGGATINNFFVSPA